MAVTWKSGQVMLAARRGAVKGVTVGIGIVEQRAVDLILKGNKTGRIYPRGGGKTHQASAPGEPFANDTGATLAARTVHIDPQNIRGRLTFRSENALRLEHGTRKMAARPYARRSLVETKGEVYEAIRAAVINEVSKK